VYDFTMFEALDSMVENLTVPPSPDAVAELSRIADRLQAKFTMAVGALHASGEYAIDGDVSVTAWLKRACGLSKKQAGAVGVTACRLRDLPVTSPRFAEGELSTTQVSIITGTVTNLTAPLFAEHESELLPGFAVLSARDLTTAMQRWQAAAEDLLRTERPDAPPRKLQVSETWNGRRELSGSFDPYAGETIDRALEMAMTYDGVAETRSYAERRGDALFDICKQFLVTHDKRRNRNRPSVGVLIDLEDLEHSGRASLRDGTPLDRATTKQILCDCDVHRIVTDGSGVTLDYGRETRLVTRELWNVLEAADRCCRFGACDRKPDWTEAHHVWAWEDGGPTEYDNLVLLCSRHHHVVHQPGWHAKLLPDRTFVVTTPTGTTIESHPHLSEVATHA
jgi:hypothetical protein